MPQLPLKTLLTAVCTLALATPLAAQENVELNAEIVERFDDLFIIDEGDRRLLVRPAEALEQTFQVGDEIRIEGRLEGDTITEAVVGSPQQRDQDAEPQRPSVRAPDVAAIQQLLAERAFGDMVELKRRDATFRITSINSDGFEVRSDIDEQGELLSWHIKRPGHDRPHRDETLDSLAQESVIDSLAEQGYLNATLLEFKGRHMEWVASNADEQTVLLHVDYRGDVYREKRLPEWPAQ
ncbi:hypothetical protein [Halomonas sp. C22]|uniref:hypothetical protein n=1 Tax=Halomonas sp. C22 TaxID=2580567 RepID=UPI00119E54BA|nr:hypothetical protein [Halomonas sp. C22]